MVEPWYEEIIEINLTTDLFRHSLGVAKSAKTLAKRYGGDPEKAYLAGLIHDYGKKYSPEALRYFASEWGYRLDKVTREQPQLLHAPLGAELVHKELGIKDPSILQAVRFHTTGAPRMSLLGRIIFLADIIEEGRSFPGVDKLRCLALQDFPRALLTATENTIKRVIETGSLLHLRSIAFRNELLWEQLKPGEWE